MLEIITAMPAAAKGTPPAEQQKTKEPRAPVEQTQNVHGSPEESGAVTQRLDPIEKIESSLTQLLDSYLGDNARLSIEHDKSTGRFIYRSIDEETGDVIAQWPDEQFLSQLEHIVAEDANLSAKAGMALDEHA
jgi:uncharacterized FlaG/YvyC family protein